MRQKRRLLSLFGHTAWLAADIPDHQALYSTTAAGCLQAMQTCLQWTDGYTFARPRKTWISWNGTGTSLECCHWAAGTMLSVEQRNSSPRLRKNNGNFSTTGISQYQTHWRNESCILPERDDVMFGSFVSQIRLSVYRLWCLCVLLTRLSLSAIFFRHCAP